MSIEKPDSVDWNELADSFDAWLPYIQPVAERLIDRLALHPGLRVLDVACGTGEPGLSIARQCKGIELIGIDSARAMVEASQRKVRREKLKGITHSLMRAEALGFQDNTFDRVVSRFGVMLFEDPLGGLREMARVLRTGGRMVFSVWSSFERVPAASIPFRLLVKQFPENERPPEPRMASLGQTGKIEALLLDAGLPRYSIERIDLIYVFDSPDELWRLASQSGFARDLCAKLDEKQREAWHQDLLNSLIPFQKGGQTLLSNEARIVVIEKRSAASPG